MPSPITKGSESDKEAPSPNDSREKMTMDPSDTIEQPTDEHPVQEEQDEPTNDSMEVELPEAVEKKDEVDTDEDEVSDIDVDTEEQETAVAKEVVVESPQPKNDEESGDKGTIIDVEKDEDSVAAVKVAADVKSFDDADTSMKNDVVSWKEQKKLGETFDAALARLQERISAAVLALRTDEHEQSQNTFTEDKQKKSNSVYASLSESAKEAYHALVRYGSKFDLSSTDSSSSKNISDTRRARLSSAGKNIWMTIRGNPDLFADIISKEAGIGGGDYLIFEGKKYQAVAGGYARAVAAQLILVDYIDTRCELGSPPCLSALTGEREKNPSIKELVFGLKVFSRSGKAILVHTKNDPQASHNTLSLATSCFHKINDMSTTNGEAAGEVNDLLDDAFDAFAMLPNAATQLAEYSKNKDKESVETLNWPNLVIHHLSQAKQLLDDFSLNSGDARLTVSRVAIMQRYLPSLARLCYKHGSQLMKIGEGEHASKALHIALDTTNSCLNEVRSAIKTENDALNEGCNQKAKGQPQVLHNLEADLVVVTIEAFYVLSHIFQTEGKPEKALQCLDMIKKYIKEQKDRDDELYATAISKVDTELFSEDAITASAIEGPKKQDKLDIKARASTVRTHSKKRHAKEKATLAFSRLMIYHKMQPHPGTDEELQIDKLLCELADLCKFSNISNTTVDGKSAVDDDHMFSLALSAARSVQVRRMSNGAQNELKNPYSVLLDKIPRSDTRHFFILLDRLNAYLSIRFQIKDLTTQLDDDILQLANEYTTAVKSIFGKSIANDKSTLFVDSSIFVTKDLYANTKAHFARGLSLYHSSNMHSSCAEYANILESILTDEQNCSGSDDTKAQLGEVIAIKAYALSMTGKSDEAYKAAQYAWELVKNIDTLVNLFHCSLRHEINHSTCDTLLELDTAINDLLLNGHPYDEVVAAFPRLSNSCVENGKGMGEQMLLGLQERWTKMLLSSKTLHQALIDNSIEGDDVRLKLGGHCVFEVLRSYLENFEHVITNKTDTGNAKACETLVQVIESALGFIVSFVREAQSQKAQKNRRKSKEEVLIWDDETIKNLVGDRSDCIWVAEQLWNLSNKLMMNKSDGKKYSARLFAGAHDFCLLSEEEKGLALSKDFLDIDMEAATTITPFFKTDKERRSCDISSEFSGQCLLLSAATAVDFAATASKLDVKNLLHRSLQRLAHAQDEFLLNSEDEAQKKEVNRMIALLTLRCLLGFEDDSLAHKVLADDALESALVELFNDETAAPPGHFGGVLQNVYLVAVGAEEKKMFSFGRRLLRSLALHMSGIDKFVLQVDEDFSLTLADIQRKVIQSASTTTDLVQTFKSIDSVVKKYKEKNINATSSSTQEAGSFYSKDELDWLAIEAYNQGVSLTLLGDHENAGVLFASALNMIPLCSNEVKSHASNMHTALADSLSRSSIGNSINAVVNQVGL